jgi:hypothetical protein
MDEVYVELMQEIRELGHTLVRFDQWATEAAERNRWQRVAELYTQRDLARERRSELLREAWMFRRERYGTGLERHYRSCGADRTVS